MTNVNDIKAAISSSGGPALGCQYVFSITPPVSMFNSTSVLETLQKMDPSINEKSEVWGKYATYTLSKSRNLSMLAEAVSIPGKQLMTTEHRIFGTVRKMPYGVLYDDLTVTFICTNSMFERSFFDIWQSLIISPSSQYMEFYENYIGTVVIQKVSNRAAAAVTTEKDAKTGNDVMVVTPVSTDYEKLSTYVLLEAYPVNIQSQELSYGDDQYLKLTVQFAYSKWKSAIDIANPRDPNLNISSGMGTPNNTQWTQRPGWRDTTPYG